MKNNFLIILCLFILTACNNDTSNQAPTSSTEPIDTTTKTTEATQLAPNDSYQLTLEDGTGAYTNGGHDESWLLTVRIVDGNLEATLFEFAGMLPPVDAFMNDKEVTDDVMVTSLILDVDLEKQTFTSELGTGKIDGGQIVFDTQEDALGDPLVLERDDSFSVIL